MEDNKNYIVYKTTFNSKTYPERAEFYYGVHHTDEDDGYLGSGVLIKNYLYKYGKEHFKREIIHSGMTMDEAYELEGLIVDEEMVLHPDCLNLQCGGIGGSKPSAQTKEKMRDARDDSFELYGITFKNNRDAAEKLGISKRSVCRHKERPSRLVENLLKLQNGK